MHSQTSLPHGAGEWYQTEVFDIWNVWCSTESTLEADILIIFFFNFFYIYFLKLVLQSLCPRVNKRPLEDVSIDNTMKSQRNVPNKNVDTDVQYTNLEPTGTEDVLDVSMASTRSKTSNWNDPVILIISCTTRDTLLQYLQRPLPIPQLTYIQNNNKYQIHTTHKRSMTQKCFFLYTDN